MSTQVGWHIYLKGAQARLFVHGSWPEFTDRWLEIMWGLYYFSQYSGGCQDTTKEKLVMQLKTDYAAAIKSWRELAGTGRRTAFSWRWVAGKVRVISKSRFDREILWYMCSLQLFLSTRISSSSRVKTVFPLNWLRLGLFYSGELRNELAAHHENSLVLCCCTSCTEVALFSLLLLDKDPAGHIPPLNPRVKTEESS